MLGVVLGVSGLLDSVKNVPVILAIAGAIAAGAAAVGPLIIKAVGDDISVPTVRGTLLAAWVVLSGTFTQIMVVTRLGWLLTPHVPGALIIFVAVVLGGVLLWFGWKSLEQIIKNNAAKPEKAPSDEAKAISEVARAIKERAAERQERILSEQAAALQGAAQRVKTEAPGAIREGTEPGAALSQIAEEVEGVAQAISQTLAEIRTMPAPEPAFEISVQSGAAFPA